MLIGALAVFVLAVLVVPMFMTMIASAPKPPEPVPPSPDTTGHEAYPYADIPPSAHELRQAENSYPTAQQQGLYAKFVGFYPDYSP